MIHFIKENYKKFFTVNEILPCIHAEFLVNGSMGKANVLVTCNEKGFDTFLDKKKINDCLMEGVEIFGNTNRYKSLLNEFKDYLDHANNVVIPKFSKVPKKLDRDEFIKTFKFISRFWYLYGFTEFAYVDLAYKVAINEKNKKMEKNLDEFSHFKFEARKVLNSYMFKNGVNDNILKYISDRFSVNARFLYVDEMVNLYNDKMIPKTIINQRSKSYFLAAVDGKIITLPYKESLKMNKEFIAMAREVNEIKGISVSPGLAKGRAIIVPMVRDHKVVVKMDKIMKRGDILVAESTSPDILVLCNKASAIVAEQSGLLSHAAVVSREMKIPCVVQVTNAVRIIKTGDLVEVDANKGIVKIIKRASKI